MRSLLLGSCLASAIGLGVAGCGTPTVHDESGNGSGNGSAGTPVTLPPPGSAGGQPPASGGPTETMNCGLTKLDLQRRPADLLLVLDRSGSMLDTVAVNSQAVPKWGEVVAALDQVVKRTESSVYWGLKLYPMGGQSCGVPDGVEVPTALSNHPSVLGLANSNMPTMDGGSTPTQSAVRKATAFLRASQSPNNKFLLLATDGEPNCAGGGGGRRSDAPGAIDAVADAQAAGISTFVVGVATAGSEAHQTLNRMADKGGRPRNDPAARYYPVTSRDELAATLEAIATQVASCTFPLNPPPPAPGNVAVDIDGVRIPKDSSGADGWSYGASNGSIVIQGPTCERLKANAAKVQIIYGCGTSIIP